MKIYEKMMNPFFEGIEKALPIAPWEPGFARPESPANWACVHMCVEVLRTPATTHTAEERAGPHTPSYLRCWNVRWQMISFL